ncbi:atypical membrane-integrating protein (Mistic protein) [Schinkia sp. CFF1]
MKVTKEENIKLSDSIDQMQVALDVFIDLYNQSEEDTFCVQLNEEVVELIQKAKNAFGDDVVNQKVNTIIKEVLSFLPLDDYSEDDKVEGEDVG